MLHALCYVVQLAHNHAVRQAWCNNLTLCLYAHCHTAQQAVQHAICHTVQQAHCHVVQLAHDNGV